MGEKSLVLENIALCEEIQKLRSLLNSRAEAYELLGQKVDMWRAAAEQYETQAKMNKEAFCVAVEKNKRYRAALEKIVRFYTGEDSGSFAETIARVALEKE